MSLGSQEDISSQKLIELFGNTMSELQINYLVKLEERVSDMEETLDSFSESTSMEQMI